MAYLEKTGAVMPLALVLNTAGTTALFQTKQGKKAPDTKSDISLGDLFSSDAGQEFLKTKSPPDAWVARYLHFAILTITQSEDNSLKK
jgi:hypothetical protein